ncbi:MAG: hypothetical protein COV07_03630 [Candidatus Vogelbacteria bacterium CG10_big_fil_rev_8_21_14_0_10_45_14]|uniref:Pilus assembly protein PilO n=1 Tax=Candidatus Vogelbacteria bacterium CG10_big_fil_rev_8_21_14_0_10_45_14 TaxID=1975042 RepID=A0A2H0RJ49_9BACT|nr:MAG: hypothetical protein COV07_03630 [Candidatus Vogelbacteria bacterium CG10_big_fil_rev_8_21_14_0_10_45_14]
MTKLIAPIVLLVLAVAIFVGFTRSELDETAKLKTRHSELQSALQNAAKLQDTRARLQNEYKTFSADDRSKLDKMLPDAIDQVKLIIDINKRASEYGMTLRNTALEPEDKEGGTLGADTRKYGSMKLSFRVSGPYAAIQRFMQDLSTSLRLIDPVSLSFRSSDKDIYEYDATIRTYWLR